jgi:hypothetical protein
MSMLTLVVKNYLEIIKRSPSLVFGSAFAGALLLRLLQTALSYQLEILERSNSSLRSRASQGGLGGMLISFWGIQPRLKGPSPQALQDGVFQRSFREPYQSKNRPGWKSLLAGMEKEENHWLLSFTADLGTHLDFFYDNTVFPIFSSTERSVVLRLILRLDNACQEKKRVFWIYPHFAAVVKTVVGSYLKNLHERQVVCIEGIWSLLDELDRGGAYTLLEAFFETHPALLDVFKQVVAPEGDVLENLNLDEVIKGLEAVHQVLLLNPDFSASLSGTKHPELKKMTCVNVGEITEACATAYNELTIPAVIAKRLGAVTKEEIKQLYDHYREYLSVYSIEVYLDAAEKAWANHASNSSNSSRNSPTLKDILKNFAQSLFTMLPPEKNKITDDISARCFKNDIEQSLNKQSLQEEVLDWGGENLNLAVTTLTMVLDPLKPMLKFGANTQEQKIQAAKNLAGVRVLIVDAGHLNHHGVDLDYICATIVINSRGGVHLLANEEPMNGVKNALRQMRLNSNSPRPVVVPAVETTAITPTQRETVLVKIKENPFLCLSKLVVPFIRQLLPPNQQFRVDNFEEKVGVLQPLFDKSSLRKEIINAISDPVISAFIEQNGLSGPFSNFLSTASERLQTLFLNISKGETTLGHTPIAEEPLHLIIEKIHKAHERRKLMWAKKQEHLGVRGKILLESKNVEKVEMWLINDLPREVETMKTATNILSVICPFLGFSIGQFNFGTPLMANVLGIVGGVLKFDGVVDRVVEKICEDEPNSPLAKFLKGLKKEEKDSLIPFLQDHVIPLITALAPVLEKRHKLEMYVQFFEDLNDLIQNNNGNIDERGEKILQQRLSQVLSQLFAELKGYGPELDKAFKCLWESE